MDERARLITQPLALLEVMLESTTDGVLVIDLQGQVLHVNERLGQLFTIPINSHPAKKDTIFSLIATQLQNPDFFLNRLNEFNRHGDEATRQALELKNGDIVECRSQGYSMEGRVVGRIWIFRGITHRDEAIEKLEFQATHDSLTELPNRLLLIDRITQAIINADRYKNQFAILFFDLDRFKLVNDSFSHEFGDALLQEIAKRLRKLVRAGDTLARFGGDEFVMIVSSVNHEEDVAYVAQKILFSFQVPFYVRRKKINLSTSIGIALYPIDGKTTKALLRNADLAMYSAKEYGGNQFRYYKAGLNLQHVKRLNQELQLKEAVQTEAFFLLYQPQFSTHNNDIIATEALIRWNHPKKGILLPIDFIPAAEGNGLIVPIEEWVLHQVCRQFHIWRAMDLPLIPINVNVSLQQLRHFSFVENLMHILESHQVDIKYIRIDISESMLVAHHELFSVIDTLNELGVRVYLDDFGLAPTGFQYVKKLGIHGIKIAPSFIKNIGQSVEEERVIQSMITKAHRMHVTVLAEGVETQAQFDFLKRHHCDAVQGYHVSEPISAELIARLVKSL